MKEADKIIKGEAKACRTFEITSPDIRKIREELEVSQADFALMIGISIKTLQNWEQGRRHPQGPALALLTIFKNSPKDAFNILHSNQP